MTWPGRTTDRLRFTTTHEPVFVTIQSCVIIASRRTW